MTTNYACACGSSNLSFFEEKYSGVHNKFKCNNCGFVGFSKKEGVEKKKKIVTRIITYQGDERWVDFILSKSLPLGMRELGGEGNFIEVREADLENMATQIVSSIGDSSFDFEKARKIVLGLIRKGFKV